MKTMNITVCIKQVPGTSEVEVDEKTGVLKWEGVDSKMNPFDLFALEAALKIEEENHAVINYARKPFLRKSLGGPALELLGRIKLAFDPENPLNPGKVCR